MRMRKRAVMQRIVGLSCGLLITAALSAGMASAAGRGAGFGASAPASVRVAPIHRNFVRPERAGGHWRGAEHGSRRGWHRRWSWAGPGYVGPWSYPDPSGTTIAVIERRPESVRPVDPDAFENLTARTGIRREPTPEPTIYRLEGPRQRPVARVIRIDAADAQGGRRTRFAHAGTGALLLTVPGR